MMEVEGSEEVVGGETGIKGWREWGTQRRTGMDEVIEVGETSAVAYDIGQLFIAEHSYYN